MILDLISYALLMQINIKYEIKLQERKAASKKTQFPLSRSIICIYRLIQAKVTIWILHRVGYVKAAHLKMIKKEINLH
jgi:hypothetical protein